MRPLDAVFPIENNLRFPGQVFLIETGLAYNWHRHYDPTTGRYTQADPLRFVDGPSVFAYAGGSPFMNVDRDGLCHIWPCYPQPAPPGPFGLPKPHTPGIGDIWDQLVAMCSALVSGEEDPCEKAKKNAESAFWDLTTKRIPQYESSITPDPKHYSTIL